MVQYDEFSGNYTHHSNGEIVGHCRNMYCPLLYLNPGGLDMIKLMTFPGRTETCLRHSDSNNPLLILWTANNSKYKQIDLSKTLKVAYL